MKLSNELEVAIDAINCFNNNIREEAGMLAANSTTHDADIDRKAISSMLMKLFDHWKLSTEEQLDVLGFATTNRAVLTKYRRGEPISGSRDTMERAGNLLAIHKNLRLLFPRQRELAYAWMKTPNRAFEHRTPTQVIRDFGFAGLLMVRAYLDRARGQ